jgi:hypothetical protein
MNYILKSVGINYELSEYVNIIQDTLCTLKRNCFESIPNNITDDNDSDVDDDNPSNQSSEDSQNFQINQMLQQHQHRIKMRCNLPSHFDQLIPENNDEFGLENNTIDNSFFDIVNRDVQQKEGVDRIFIMKTMGETRGKIFILCMKYIL